jgi:glycosyltransferase 2 family protein
MLKQWLQRAQPFLVAVSLVLIGLLLRSQWAELQAHSWRLHPGWLAVSAFFMGATWLVEVSLWRRLLAVVGGGLPFAAAWRIWFLTALVRYVPGNIWQPLSMTLYCQRRGIRPEATLMSMVLYQAVTMLAVMPIAGVYLLLYNQQGLLSQLVAGLAPWLVAAGLMPVLVFLVRPELLVQVVNWALNKVGRPALAAQLTSRTLFFLLLVGVLSWLLWGASFAALTFALRPYTNGELVRLAVPLVAVFSVGYAVGFLSLITPSGFGVREGAYYLLLVPLLDGATVAVAALAMRIWIIVAEVVVATGALLWKTGAEETALPASAYPGGEAYAQPLGVAGEPQLE